MAYNLVNSMRRDLPRTHARAPNVAPQKQGRSDSAGGICGRLRAALIAEEIGRNLVAPVHRDLPRTHARAESGAPVAGPI